MIHALALLSAILLALPLAAHEGWGVVIHPRMGVVVADIPGNTVWRFQGGDVKPLVRDVHSHDLHLGPDGAIYGTNPEPAGPLTSVWRMNANGEFSYVVAPSAASPLGLQSFLFTRAGAVYSASRYDHRRPAVLLLRRAPDGVVRFIAGRGVGHSDGRGAAAQFTAIDGIREAPDGVLLVDGAHLRTVTPEGLVITRTAPLTQPKWGEDLLGLSTVRGGVVHVADHAGRRVLRVDLSTGVAREAYRSGLLWAPAGVEVSGQDLYVLEHLRPPLALLGDLQIGPYLRVRHSNTPGRSETVGMVWGRHTAVGVAAVVLLSFMGIVLVQRIRQRIRKSRLA